MLSNAVSDLQAACARFRVASQGESHDAEHESALHLVDAAETLVKDLQDIIGDDIQYKTVTVTVTATVPQDASLDPASYEVSIKSKEDCYFDMSPHSVTITERQPASAGAREGSGDGVDSGTGA